MFSITPSEFLTIAVIALIVFGPRRLAEIAKRAGKMTAELKRTTDELRTGIEDELGEVVAPFREAASDLGAIGKKLVETDQGELTWADVDNPPPAESADPPAENTSQGDGGEGPVETTADDEGEQVT